ncbi:CAP domain-containing protein [Mesorhizobium sp. KR9-304]|uniref:CAP domain-containing protein n=1 Tax=Mesorhizobium sp. KR9-304 TaxID=3156614 RepID=UPI0032B4816E
MTNDIRRPHRPVAAIALIALLATAGCQNVFSMVSPKGVGEGVGASTTGEMYLTSIRTEHGLPALVPDRKLERAAAQQAAYMARADAMSHRTGWRKDFATRMKENGVEGAAAENVAHGAMDPEKLFSMWMDSKGHRRNMLDPRFARYGLASAEDGQGRKYWALVLGR